MADSRKGWNPKIVMLAWQLSSNSVMERNRAEQYIYSLGPNAVPVLKELLIYERDQQIKHRQNRVYACFASSILTLPLGAMIIGGLYSHQVIGRLDVFVLACLWVFVVTAPLLRWLQPGRTQSHAVRLLARYEDVRVLGPLLDVLDSVDRETGEIVERALIHLLPRLRASDASLLSESHYHRLYRALSSHKAELILAILQALEQVGDHRAIPYVQPLADGQGSAATNWHVHVAAQECLPSLRERAQQEDVASTLLRASDIVPSGPDVLLRPAGGASETNPQQLLRASMPDEAE
jgi:hypothetical protein